MKKKIIYGLLFAVAMVTASSSFVSCKDYEGDDYANLKEQNLTLKKALQDQIEAMSLYALKTDLKDWALKSDLKDWALKSDLKDWALKSDLDDYAKKDDLKDWALKTDLDEYLKKADYEKMDTTALHNWILSILQSVNALQNDSVAKYAELIHQNNVQITMIGDTLHKFVYTWGDDLTEALENAGKARAIAKSYDADTAAINRAIEKAQEIADLAWNYVNQGQAKDRNGETKEDLQAWVKYFEDADDALQDQINELREDVDNILGTMKKQITGVIVQGAYSPVLGYGALPFGVQTNLLAAYAGKATAAVEFPTADAGLYADLRGEDDEPAISVEDYNYLNGLGLWPAGVTVAQGEYFVSEAEDNAGKLYLTVNPTKLDFTGTQFKLVNSQGKEVKVELSAIRPSDEVMHFGWTRGTSVEAPSANGFYEVNAQITKENVADMQPNIKKEVIVNAAKKVIKEHTKTSVKDLAQALFSGMQNVLQRNAVEASWFDETLGENRAYTSEYAIAAAAVHPLGFSFLKDVNVPKTRYTQLPKFTKQLIADSLHINHDIKKLEVTTAQREDGTFVILVEIPRLDLDPQAIDVYTDAEGNVTAMYYGYPIYSDAYGEWRFGNIERRNGYAYIDMTPVFEELFGRFNDAFAGLNTLDTQFNGKIDNIVDQVNYYINKYNSIADRVNNAINSLPVRINNMLQPVLLYQSAKGFSRMSASFLATTHLRLNGQAEGEISILPTSYSLELLAPSYKKSLLVTNVYKTVDGKVQSAQGVQGDLEAALKDLNGQLADYACFSSYTKGAKLQVKKEYAGMTFEIAYTAVDYNGKVAGRKFYFTVAE